MAYTRSPRSQPRHSAPRPRVQGPEGWPASARLSIPGWVLVPLRAFLGVTFTYAGLQKLANRSFFSASAPGSLEAQMQGAARNSPVHSLVSLASHHALLVGLLIAFGELAVGLGTLLGLWARAAAIAGALLSFSFFLTVSFHAQPYYYGADIVFVFAWSPLILVGAGNVLSLDAILAGNVRRQEGLPPTGTVPIEFATVRRLCGAYEDGRCRVRSLAGCDPAPCPVLAARTPDHEQLAPDASRRAFLQQATVAGAVGAGALLAGGVAAIAGRLVPPSRSTASAPTLGSGGSPTTSTSAPAGQPPASQSPAGGGSGSGSAPSGSSPAATPKGTLIGPASDVAVGGAASFNDPGLGVPAYVVQPVAGQFKAFSAVCTHAGCTVQFSRSDETFQCPCHGAVYSAKTGEVLGGPAPSPLPAITVAEGPNGQLYVDG